MTGTTKMKKLNEDRLRTIEIHFLVSHGEREHIEQKMKEAGISSLAAYMRKMAIDGYVVDMDLSDVKELVRLLRICSNNLNQYAKKANESGKVYGNDIDDLQAKLDGIWDETKNIMAKLSALL